MPMAIEYRTHGTLGWASLGAIKGGVSLKWFVSGEGMYASITQFDESVAKLLWEVDGASASIALTGSGADVLRHSAAELFIRHKVSQAIAVSGAASVCNEQPAAATGDSGARAGLVRRLESLSFWIPRKHRRDVRADLEDDVIEMTREGLTPNRILMHVYWQLSLCAVVLLPRAWWAFVWTAAGAWIARFMAR